MTRRAFFDAVDNWRNREPVEETDCCECAGTGLIDGETPCEYCNGTGIWEAMP